MKTESQEVHWADLSAFHELVREQSEMVESVTMYDSFVHPTTRRVSLTFSIRFAPVASMRDSAKLAAEANESVREVGKAVVQQHGVELR